VRVLRMIVTIAVTVLPFSFIHLAPSGYVQWALYAVAVGVYALIVSVISGWIFEPGELKAVAKRLKRMLYSKA